MKYKPKFTQLQLEVFKIIKDRKQIRIIEIAEILFEDVDPSLRPKSTNNCVTSAIAQMNKKFPKLILGDNHGWQGKTVYIGNISDRTKAALGSTRV